MKRSMDAAAHKLLPDRSAICPKQPERVRYVCSFSTLRYIEFSCSYSSSPGIFCWGFVNQSKKCLCYIVMHQVCIANFSESRIGNKVAKLLVQLKISQRLIVTPHALSHHFCFLSSYIHQKVPLAF